MKVMRKERKATTTRLGELDQEALAIIKAYYGVSSNNAAIVLALRVVAAQIRAGKGDPSQAPDKERRLTL